MGRGNDCCMCMYCILFLYSIPAMMRGCDPQTDTCRSHDWLKITINETSSDDLVVALQQNVSCGICACDTCCQPPIADTCVFHDNIFVDTQIATFEHCRISSHVKRGTSPNDAQAIEDAFNSVKGRVYYVYKNTFDGSLVQYAKKFRCTWSSLQEAV